MPYAHTNVPPVAFTDYVVRSHTATADNILPGFCPLLLIPRCLTLHEHLPGTERYCGFARRRRAVRVGTVPFTFCIVALNWLFWNSVPPTAPVQGMASSYFTRFSGSLLPGLGFPTPFTCWFTCTAAYLCYADSTFLPATVGTLPFGCRLTGTLPRGFDAVWFPLIYDSSWSRSLFAVAYIAVCLFACMPR